MQQPGKLIQVRIRDLQPNNWYINQDKLDQVRQAWKNGQQDMLPPVLVTMIDGVLGLIDGHSRTYAAYENGAIQISALLEKIEDIEGSTALYKHIHREGPALGIKTIADLKDRILCAETHKRLWTGYCSAWLEEHEQN